MSERNMWDGLRMSRSKEKGVKLVKRTGSLNKGRNQGADGFSFICGVYLFYTSKVVNFKIEREDSGWVKSSKLAPH